ncbi:MAG: MBL fold metallo-hydrolase [Verrucomicrobiota bacterium]
MRVFQILKQILADCARKETPAPHTPSPLVWSPTHITASWLGHATVLLNFRGVVILTDPTFMSRVGIRIWPITIGPKRYTVCALKPTELPRIDLVLLSHAHMDHLDLPSLKALQPDCIVVTAGATADIFSHLRFRSIVEIDWDETRVFETKNGAIKITGKKLKHWGARTRTDTHRRYNAYILERDGIRICFAGDTARTSSQHLASDGPIDLMIVPIGAYHPWINNHCTPEEAIEMADEASATYLLPIHHQTFRLSWEPIHEPISRFRAALQHAPHRIALTEIGETFRLPPTPPQAPESF